LRTAQELALGDAGADLPARDEALARMLDFRLRPDLAGRLTLARKEIWASRKAHPSRALFSYDHVSGEILQNWRLAQALVARGGGWSAKTEGLRNRFRYALHLLNELGPQLISFHADMADRRLGVGRRNATGAVIPVFQHNREAQAQGAILWPLAAHFQRLGSPTFFGGPRVDNTPFVHKRPVIFWRGALSGKTAEGIVPQMLQRGLKDGSISPARAACELQTLPRFALLKRFQAAPFCDLALTRGSADLLAQAFGLRQTSRVTRAQICKARYQVVVEGNDRGSNFPWLCDTNCLILRQDMHWEAFYDCLFQPWVHFVPLARDFSDLEEKFNWCEANPDRCREIIANAQAMARLIASPGFIEASNAQVIARYRAFARGLVM